MRLLTLSTQMPIWSFTTERLEKLKKQIAYKKAEHDALECKSEKDLWCKDLDEFLDEWDTQLKLDAEIQTSIRRMGRRVSKKIGAGGKRRPKDDDAYLEKKPARAPAKAVKPVEKKEEVKSHQRFNDIFSAKTKSKSKGSGLDGADDDLSDDDFAALIKPKVKKEAAPAADESAAEPEEDLVIPKPRVQRTAAAKPKNWAMDLVDSESDNDDEMLGDVGAMVKGIGAPAAETDRGRVSLYAMSRPETSQGDSLPKLKSKQSRTFDFDGHDDTNYEALALSSPRKSVRPEDVLDLSDDDDDRLPPVTKAAPPAKASSSAGGAVARVAMAVVPVATKKGRGRPAGAKNKPKEAEKPKPAHLSPAAKAYAARKAAKARAVLSDDEDEDGLEAPAPPPAAVAKPRGRPARAAAATTKKKPIYLDSESDEEDVGGGMDVDEDSDEFGMDDSE